MTSMWPLVRLGEVVTPIQRPEVPVPGVAYRQLGVRLWGEGAYEREPVDGSATKYSRLFRAEAGDLVLNKIWARHGSIAVVQAALAGTYGSNEFPMFTPKADRIEPAWLHWFSKTKDLWRQLDEASRGTSGKNRIRPERILDVVVPLPPLHKQQQVLRRIKAVAAELEMRTDAVRHTEADLDALLRSILANDPDLTPTPMRDLVKLRHLDVQVQPTETYQFAGVYSFGRGVFRAQRKFGADFAYTRLTTLRAGDFTYPKLMAWEGAFGVVPSACEGHVVSPEFPVFKVDRCLVLPVVLDIHFRDPSVWPVLAGTSTGTNARRRRLNLESLLAYLFPLPSFRTQERVGQIFEEVVALRRTRAEADAEAVQLLPTLLMETFSGGAPLAAERSFVTH